MEYSVEITEEDGQVHRARFDSESDAKEFFAWLQGNAGQSDATLRVIVGTVLAVSEPD